MKSHSHYTRLYRKRYVYTGTDRLHRFRILKQNYTITSVIYPGSFIHITPSLVFPITTYIDTDDETRDFFYDPAVFRYIEQNRAYTDMPKVTFYHADYRTIISDELQRYDLLISQHAGPVSSHCIDYLIKDGILLVERDNDDEVNALQNERLILTGCFRKVKGNTHMPEKLLNYYLLRRSRDTLFREYLDTEHYSDFQNDECTALVFRKVK